MWTGQRLENLPRYLFIAVVIVTALTFRASRPPYGRLRDRLGHPYWTAQPVWHWKLGSRGSPVFVGYLFLPAVLGLILADAVTRFTRRRLMTLPDPRMRSRP